MSRRRWVALLLAVLAAVPVPDAAASGSGSLSSPSSEPSGMTTAGSVSGDAGQVIRVPGAGRDRRFAADAPGACSITAGGSGGTVSACPDATNYSDLVAGLDAGFEGLGAQSRTSSVSITSDPPGAQVDLNSVPAGVTPFQGKVRGGSYLVRVSKAGYAPSTRTITASPDRPAELSVKLEADGGSSGSFVAIQPEYLIALLGADGFQDGSLDIGSFVTDGDGKEYISFVNSKGISIELPGPEEGCPGVVGTPEPCNWQSYQQFDNQTLTVWGVAASEDAGQTWRLLKSWKNDIQSRAWTSKRFVDTQWNHDDPGEIQGHWVHVYYRSFHYETVAISALVPRAKGVTVEIDRTVFDQPQQVEFYYDNLPSVYCRADDIGPGGLDDPDPQGKYCHYTRHPGRYIGNITFDIPAGIDVPYKSTGTDEAKARFGFGDDDLTTYKPVRTYGGSIYDSATGQQTDFDASSTFGVVYQGSHAGTDYFFAVANDGTSRVFSSVGDAIPTVLHAFTLPGPAGRNAMQRLEVADDGTLYVIDSLYGRVFRLEDGQPVLLGQVPADRWGGLMGTQVPGYYGLPVAFDSGGNVYGAYVFGDVPEGGNVPTTVHSYSVFFPKEPIAFTGVALFTRDACDACDASRKWLKDAGVDPRVNPSDLPAALADQVAAAVASGAYPIAVRLGPDPVVVGNASPTVLARLLGSSYPVPVETHTARIETRNGAFGLQPDWALPIVENDVPRVLVQRDEGVVAYTDTDGALKPEKVLGPIPLIEPVTYATSGGTTTSFKPRGPVFPGRFAKVSDLTFLHRSVDQPQTGRFVYQLWSTKGLPKFSAYRAITQVSQLIPTGVLDVQLGEKGEVAAKTACEGAADSAVRGDLCRYVTSEGLVEEDGQRLYRVTVDLGKQNETAQEGNLVGRTIGGSVRVATQVEGGDAHEFRDVSLLLLVENHRLVFWDPSLAGAAHDISTETIHFTGADDRWVVVNNLGLPNEIPCGEDQALYLPPHSLSTYTRQTQQSYELTCLSALEVPPTPVDGCQTWDQIKAKLATETIDALAQSLPLLRSTSRVTNWELAFGSRDATVRRIVSLDAVPSAGGGPRCGTEVDGKTAAVLEISGTILGGADAAYTPSVRVADTGTATVATAPLARPEGLAWEARYLELESAFLEAQLQLSVQNAGLMEALTLQWTAKQARYQRWLVATRALLHCNAEGRDLRSVMRLIGRALTVPGANRGTSGCLQDFVISPSKHWRTYDPALISLGYRVSLAALINQSLAADPALSFLASGPRGRPELYESFLVQDARNGSSGGAPSDGAFDDYARIKTAIFLGLGGVQGALTRAVILASPLERTAVDFVLECARGLPAANPFPQLLDLTSKLQYTAGLPCVDTGRVGGSKVIRYQLLSFGLRSDLFGAIFAAAGGDLGLLFSYLDQAHSVVATVAAADARYPAGTTIASWNLALPPLDRFFIVQRALEGQARHLTVGDVTAVAKGFLQCALGAVKLAVIGGATAFVLGAVGVAASNPIGLVFLGSGVVFTGVGLSDLTTQWGNLDLQQKTAGACETIVGIALLVAPAMGVGRGPRRTAAASPEAPAMIDVETLPSRGNQAGLTMTEQAKVLADEGATVAATPEPPAPPPLDPALQERINLLPEGERAEAEQIARDLRYEDMDPLRQGVLREVLGKPRAQWSDTIAFGTRSNLREPAIEAAWTDIGAALNLFKAPPPKSFAVAVRPAEAESPTGPATPAGVTGSDAPLLEAAANPAPSLDSEPNLPATEVDPYVVRKIKLLEAWLDSEDLVVAVGEAQGTRALTQDVADYLLSVELGIDPSITPAFFSELSSVDAVDAFRGAIAKAKLQAEISDPTIAGIKAKVLGSGTDKTALKVDVTTVDKHTATFVVAKGEVSAEEIGYLKRFAGDGLTAQVYGELPGVDGSQSLLMTEYVEQVELPKFSPDDITNRVVAMQEDWYADAIGGFDGGLLVASFDEATGTTIVNNDHHLGNINVKKVGDGKYVAKAIDFGKQTEQVPVDDAIALFLMRRSPHYPNQAYAGQVADFTSEVNGFLTKLGARSEWQDVDGLKLLRRVADRLTDPALIDWMNTFQPAKDPALRFTSDLGRAVQADVQNYVRSHGLEEPPPLNLLSIPMDRRDAWAEEWRIAA